MVACGDIYMNVWILLLLGLMMQTADDSVS